MNFSVSNPAHGALARLLMLMLVALVAGGCAGLAGRDAPVVRVAGLQPLASEEFELRFALKLRVQNPDDTPLSFDGVSVNLDVDGYGLASGVSDQKGVVPRFGETLVTVPVTVSAFAALRQLFGRMSQSGRGWAAAGPDGVLKYELTGKFGGAGGLSAIRFNSSGQFSMNPEISEQRQ